MAENNGLNGLSEFAESVRRSMDERRRHLVADLSPAWPALRKFLIGGEIAGRVYPAGEIRIWSEVADVVVRLAIPPLGIQAEYREQSANSLIEQIENDLDTETVPWENDWQVKKKMRDKQRKAIGLS